jgi:hypothetical protein
VFPKDVPASWLLATYYALMHAAAGEVNAVREPFLKSYRTPPTRGEQAGRPSREALSPDGRARGEEERRGRLQRDSCFGSSALLRYASGRQSDDRLGPTLTGGAVRPLST